MKSDKLIFKTRSYHQWLMPEVVKCAALWTSRSCNHSLMGDVFFSRQPQTSSPFPPRLLPNPSLPPQLSQSLLCTSILQFKHFLPFFLAFTLLPRQLQ